MIVGMVILLGILLGCALLCFFFVFLVLEDFDFFDDFEDFTLLSFVLSFGDFRFTIFSFYDVSFHTVLDDGCNSRSFFFSFPSGWRHVDFLRYSLLCHGSITLIFTTFKKKEREHILQ